MIMTRITIPVLVLAGPTAIGKTGLALQIASRHDCEIISMDSMQVYRYMDIGTAKPSPAELAAIPHHLIDILDPDEQYDASKFVRDCRQVLERLQLQGRGALITGGTGLYLKALLQGLFSAPPTDPQVRQGLLERLQREGRQQLFSELAAIDPETAARIHVQDTQRLLRGLEIYQLTGTTWTEHLARQEKGRPPVWFSRLFQAGLQCSRERLYKRISERTHLMLRQGLLEEVESLLDMGYGADLASMQAIGYRHAVSFLSGKVDRKDMETALIRDTRRYAKRQMTWFSRQAELRWYHRDDRTAIMRDVDRFMAQDGKPEAMIET